MTLSIQWSWLDTESLRNNYPFFSLLEIATQAVITILLMLEGTSEPLKLSAVTHRDSLLFILGEGCCNTG